MAVRLSALITATVIASVVVISAVIISSVIIPSVLIVHSVAVVIAIHVFTLIFRSVRFLCRRILLSCLSLNEVHVSRLRSSRYSEHAEKKAKQQGKKFVHGDAHLLRGLIHCQSKMNGLLGWEPTYLYESQPTRDARRV